MDTSNGIRISRRHTPSDLSRTAGGSLVEKISLAVVRIAPSAGRRRALLGAAAALAASPRAFAQRGYPERAITLVVPFAPGGIADLTARLVARAMGASLDQSIVVDNRPSAGGIVATTAVVNAAPDGYTLLLMSDANAVSASLFRKLPYDVTRDLAPVGTLGFFDLVGLLDDEARATEDAESTSDPNEPLPPHVKVTRGRSPRAGNS